MQYQQRIQAVQQVMKDREIDLMYLPLSANLFYLAGIKRELVHGTDHNRYGDWLCGGYIAQEGPIKLVAARMGGKFWAKQVADKPWISDLELINEPIDPKTVLKQVLAAYGLENGRYTIAIDDRTWGQFVMGVLGILPETTFVSATEIIAPMRMIKTPEELQLMQAASDITDQVFRSVIPKIKVGMTEFDIESEIDYQFVNLGAEYTSFETGVTFWAPEDEHGGPKNDMGMRILQRGDSIMFDFGGLINGYASDFGRSAYCGTPTDEYLIVHDTVIKSQADAMAAMIAGQCTAAEANRVARKVIEDAGYGDGFGHRLGHGIGVTVHEPPFLDGLDEIVLRENMVFTVEPSIVYKGRFANRIEDMVVVTKDGGKPMSKIERKLYIID